MTHEKLMKELNKIVNHHLGRSPNFRYFEDGKKNRYFWTTGSIMKDNKKRFISGVYVYKKMKKQFALRNKVHHSRRHKAKERANKLYEKSKEKLNSGEENEKEKGK